MISALILISRRQWQRHKLRLLLTAMGIALGVAAFFAILTTNSTLVSSLNGTIERLAGRSTLQVTAGDSGFDQSYLELVRDTPGVARSEPVVETVVQTANDEKLMILGLDTGSELELYSGLFETGSVNISNPLAFTSRNDSIAVSRQFAERMGLKDGSELRVIGQDGERTLIVRAVFDSAGASEIFDGNIAVMDIYAAQELWGKQGKLDRIDLLNTSDVAAETVQQRLREQFPAAIKVERPGLRGKGLENAVSTMQFGLEIMSVLAFIVCGFLVFNSFSVSVHQRRREIGILRSLGTEGRSIQLMFLGEAFVVGIVGSAIGILAGYFFAMAAMSVVSRVSAMVYGFASAPGDLMFDPSFAAEAFVIGVLAAVLAAWLPSRAAGKLDPMRVLVNVGADEREGRLSRPRIVTGLILVALGMSLTFLTTAEIGTRIQLFYALIVQVGMIFLLPLIIRYGGRVLSRPISYVFGVEGKIAVEAMSRAPKRTASTVGALMVGLAFVFSTAAFIASQKTALSRSIDRSLDADVLITSSDRLQSSTYHFSPATRDRLISLPGVAVSDALRVASTEFGGDTVSVLAHEMDAYFAISPDLLDEGDRESARRITANGEGVLISNNLAFRSNIDIGDEITIDAPGGSFRLPVVGRLNYYRSEVGTIFLDRSVYKRYWNDDDVDYVLIDLKPGTDAGEFKRMAGEVLRNDPSAFVYDHEEFKGWVGRLIDQFFALMYLQMVVAIFVAALGLINTMIISVDERTREIGIFRAIGGLRGQVIKMVLIEAIAISLIGMAAAAGFGLINAYFLVNTAAKVIAGFSISLVLPYSLVLTSVPFVLAIALISALFPAIKAARLKVPDAIGYE